MKAQLYLSNFSFENNSFDSITDVQNAIIRLADDYDFIKQFGDVVLKHESIYDTELFPGFTIIEVLYTDNPSPISRDVKKRLLKIVDHSNLTTWNNEEIIELIVEQEIENLCDTREVYGILALNNISNLVPEKFTIYNKQNLFDFHRYFLSHFPCDEKYFVEQCIKCFPSLYFHEQVATTIRSLEGGWENFVSSLVTHLVKLNDIFPTYLAGKSGYQRIEVLHRFGAECHIDISTQGHAADKKHMTFAYIDNSGARVDICCEPHMKLSKSDTLGDTHHYFNRIYFHEGHESVQNGRILVGYIGEHINFA